MNKTLGEVNEDAFEDAYQEHMDKAPMGYGSSWVDAAERLAWQAAAEAVLKSQRAKLRELVAEWRGKEATNRRAIFAIGEHFAAADTYEACADELEALLEVE